MEAVNAPLRRLVEAFFGLVGGWPTWVGIAIATFVVMLVAMPILKWTLVPAWTERTKRGLAASVLELRLYNDRLGAVFRSILAMLVWTAGFVGAMLIPLVVTGAVLLLPFAHLHSWWGFEGLEPGDTTTLRLHVPGQDGKPEVTIEAPPGVAVETPALWIASHDEIVWRLRAEAPGMHQLRFRVAGTDYTKDVTVADGVARRSPERCTSALNQFLYPVEPPLPADGPVSHMSLAYEDGPSFLLVPVWCWILILFSFVFYFPLKKPFGVEI